jgi:hypothetical protein
MSATPIVEPTTLPKLTPLSVPLRKTLLTLFLTIGTLALSGFIWREQGYEMLIVAMGWPHVILGFTFYFGRVMRGEANTRSTFLLLALLTTALWIIHYNYLITGLIYLYFLYHAFRDEIFVYLQAGTRHRPGASVYAVAGVGPLILLMLLVPKQQDFRQDLRRVNLAGTQLATHDWTLISFKPVADSAGRKFYFHLQAPHSEGLQALFTRATIDDTRHDGQILIGDQEWSEAKDLDFRPHYSGETLALPNQSAAAGTQIPVLLTGGHRVGQTFQAQQNNLDGIWLPIDRVEQPGEATQLVFHLASPPLLPYSPPLANLRLFLLILLGLYVLYRLVPRRGQSSQLWIYLLVLVGAFASTQMILKSSNNAGYPFPLIFQFVVVFHYWSWYVYSFTKLRTTNEALPPSRPMGGYDRVLGYLRWAPGFTGSVIGLNLISMAGVLWYYQLNGPPGLRFAFDYSYFLYVLVLHVTFSFSPKASQS